MNLNLKNILKKYYDINNKCNNSKTMNSTYNKDIQKYYTNKSLSIKQNNSKKKRYLLKSLESKKYDYIESSDNYVKTNLLKFIINKKSKITKNIIRVFNKNNNKSKFSVKNKYFLNKSFNISNIKKESYTYYTLNILDINKFCKKDILNIKELIFTKLYNECIIKESILLKELFNGNNKYSNEINTINIYKLYDNKYFSFKIFNKNNKYYIIDMLDNCYKIDYIYNLFNIIFDNNEYGIIILIDKDNNFLLNRFFRYNDSNNTLIKKDIKTITNDILVFLKKHCFIDNKYYFEIQFTKNLFEKFYYYNYNIIKTSNNENFFRYKRLLVKNLLIKK